MTSMPSMSFDSLPDELVLSVFNCLDSRPPSAINANLEPSPDLLKSSDRPLNSLSLVSRRFRRAVLPLLFRHLRLSIEDDPHDEASPVTAEDSHEQQSHLSNDLAWIGEVVNLPGWIYRAFRSLHDLSLFLGKSRLAPRVESLVLIICRNEVTERREKCDSNCRAPSVFWHRMFTLIDPLRVAILAPPPDLALLTACAINLEGERLFSDMKFHLLEVKRDKRCDSLDARTHRGPRDLPAQGGSSNRGILYLRPWEHVSLNEGSFLTAYPTEETNDMPPTIIDSVLRTFPDYSITAPPEGRVPLYSLRSFTFTAIFPFASHLNLASLLPRVEVLEVQLAPDLRPGSADDIADLMNNDLLQDYLLELTDWYFTLVRQTQTSSDVLHMYPKLKKIVSRDFQCAAIRDPLDRIFTPLCLPVWAEYEPGVFTRLTSAAPRT